MKTNIARKVHGKRRIRFVQMKLILPVEGLKHYLVSSSRKLMPAMH
jgi:hypothetical protein